MSSRIGQHTFHGVSVLKDSLVYCVAVPFLLNQLPFRHYFLCRLWEKEGEVEGSSKDEEEEKGKQKEEEE